MRIHSSPSGKTTGFTLVEMSIVLVILAVAAGGILTGTHMIRAAKIRSIVNEKEVFTQTLRTFKDRYKFYPGDLPNATNIWGELDASAANCVVTASLRSGTDTCNGNGDGVIAGVGNGTFTTDNTKLYEMFRLWQHLVNAELLKGYYTGIPFTSADVTTYAVNPLRPANSAAVFGLNAPESAFRGSAGWNIATTWGLYNSCNDTSGKDLNGNVLVFASNAVGENFNIGLTDGVDNLLTPQETKALDDKSDDGKPTTGNIQATGLTCSVDCSANTNYNVSSEAKNCGVLYVNQF